MTDDATLAFIQSLLTDGRVQLTVPDPVVLGPRTDAAITASDSAWRAELPGNPPPLDLPAARWALTIVHRISQFILWRDVGEADIKAALLVPCPSPRGPQTDYSADLFFRFLPALHRHALRLAPGDSLVADLAALAVAWPLSSPGIPLPEGSVLRIDSFAAHPSLIRLYADRILAAGDQSRLSDPRPLAAVAEALGAYPDLCPALRLETVASV